MAVLIDTSIVIAAERDRTRSPVLRERIADEPVAMSAMTVSELLHGAHRAETAVRRERRLRFVEAILQAISVLSFDVDVARVHSRIWADLAAGGRMIGAHDLIIAATAVAHDLPIVTHDPDHFDRVEGLRVETW